MKPIQLTALAAAIIAPAMMTAIPGAHAQVSGIATAQPTMAIARSKAFSTANQQITTTYKSSLDQIDAKRKSRQALLAKLDTNNDKKVDDAELQKAKSSNSPVLTQLNQADSEIESLSEPALKAQAYAIEQIAQKYDAAQQQVITSKKINIVLSPDALLYAPDNADITSQIVAQLDQSAPSVAITPPANWQPSRQVLQLQQQLQQIQQVAALQAAQQARQAASSTQTAPAQNSR
ncbi:OmpH family outer membrane protein [Stakelama sp. CBK3Z-3]|uniref:OmpH family outer membrane protein n=1 Tax=Stakelama flava TaxID=2860338 RepID=A0ABS6XL10_9SPHN|nr:OmpH family outer membrane protein [Stakelama flava]MBW4330899.1 OmpH family outer membrane protein [Stakelama flava]